jgi:hypothetical protein
MADYTLEELLAEKARRSGGGLGATEERPTTLVFDYNGPTPTPEAPQAGAMGGSPFSLEELLAEKARRQPVTGGEVFAGGMTSLLNGMSFGLGDEIVATGNAAWDKWAPQALGGTGESFGSAYDKWLASVRGDVSAFKKEAPVASPLIEIGGSISNPLGALGAIKKGAGVATNLGRLAGSGAAYGGLYGFGSGEGGVENRLKDAAISGAVGGVLNPVLGGTAYGIGKGIEKFGDSAPNFFNRSMGATKADFTQSANRAGLFKSDEEYSTYIGEALENLRTKHKILEKGTSEQSLLKAHTEKSNALSKEITSLLRQADQQIGATKIKPKFKNAEQYIKEAGVAEQEGLEAALQHYKDSLTKRGKGTLEGLHKEKQALYETAYPQLNNANLRKGLDRAIAKDIKEAVENVSDSVLPKDKAGKIKALNRDLGDFEETKHIFKREVAKSEHFNPLQWGVDNWKTTGGFGVPIILGAMSGEPEKGIGYGALFAGAMSRPGQRALGKLAEKSLGVSGASPFVPNAKSVFSPLVSMANQPDKTQSKGDRQTSKDKIPTSMKKAVKESPGQGKGSSLKNVSLESLQSSPLAPLIKAVIDVESAGNPKAVSPAGAKGLMQLMPANIEHFGVSDPFDPAQNIEAGTALLEEELERFGDVQLALAAYNAGSPKVMEAIKKAGSTDFTEVSKYLPDETKNYVPKVLKKLTAFA